MVCALSIGPTTRINVDNLVAVSTEPKTTACKIMLTADVPFHVECGENPTATIDSLRVAETSRPPLIISVGAGQVLSFLAESPGSVWATLVN